MDPRLEMTSLRDINLKLRDNNHRQVFESEEEINDKFDEAAYLETKEQEEIKKKYTWVKDEIGDYFTYVSDLNEKIKRGLPRNQCPRCRGYFHARDLQKRKKAYFLYRCPDCGVMLTVYRR